MSKFFDIQMRGETQLFLFEGFLGYWPLVREEVQWMLGNVAPNDEIELHIDSMGGDPRTAMAIRRALDKHQGRITCFVEGDCMSAVTLLPGAADEIISGPHSIWLIHNPEIDAGFVDDTEAEATKEWIRIIKEQMIAIYVKDTGQDAATIEAWMKETKVFDGAEAVELGFADRTEETEERLVVAGTDDIRIAASAYKLPQEKLKGRSSSEEVKPKTQNQPDMDWMKKIKAALGLGDDKDEADAVMSVKELKARADAADELQTKVDDLTDQNTKLQEKLDELKGKSEETQEEAEAAEVAAKETAVQAAIDDFRIKAADKEGWLEDYEDKPAEKLKAALERIPEGAAKPGGNSGPKKPGMKARALGTSNLNDQAAKELGVK